MKNKMNMVIGSIILLSVVGCSDMNRQDVGVLTGGAIGGLVGSRFGHGSGQVLATGLGVVAGAVIGGKIGQYMDQQDHQQVVNTLEHNRTQAASTWRNPDSGNQYTVTPTRTYQSSGTYCREYTTKAIINGKESTMYGKACRQPDGSWKAMS